MEEKIAQLHKLAQCIADTLEIMTIEDAIEFNDLRVTKHEDSPDSVFEDWYFMDKNGNFVGHIAYDGEEDEQYLCNDWLIWDEAREDFGWVYNTEAKNLEYVE